MEGLDVGGGGKASGQMDTHTPLAPAGIAQQLSPSSPAGLQICADREKCRITGAVTLSQRKWPLPQPFWEEGAWLSGL